jgi:glycogen debranching enzyme
VSVTLRDGDGFLEYQRDGGVVLVNQGWKDSTDSVRFRDGRIASPRTCSGAATSTAAEPGPWRGSSSMKTCSSGFGIRTMGAREGGYDPVSDHDGSVWPHDDAVVLAGLVRCGVRAEATRLAQALLQALARFPDAEPPEPFCGYPAARLGTPGPVPVRLPAAGLPRGWRRVERIEREVAGARA